MTMFNFYTSLVNTDKTITNSFSTEKIRTNERSPRSIQNPA